MSIALIVIDMQLCAFDGKITAAINCGSQLLEKTAEGIAIVRAANLPVIYVQTCAASGRPYAKDMHGWEIHPKLAPLPEDTVVFKKGSSAFEGTDLHKILQARELDHVVCCGNWSEFCVANTCVSALELGYKVDVFADAHGTVKDSDADAVRTISQQNELLAGKGVQVYPVDEFGQHAAN